jgi:hypothetical protein
MNPVTQEANTLPRGGLRWDVFARPVPAQEVVQRSRLSDLFVVPLVSMAGTGSVFMAVFIAVFMALYGALYGALFVRIRRPWRLWRGLFLD